MARRLGPFVLQSFLARGGMGDVYRARHVDSDIPVAVKVLRGDRDRTQGRRRAFREEVRAATRLRHPEIVMVLDYGEVTESAAAGSEGALVPGSPYLVMELASGGSLADVQGTLHWGQLRRVLLMVLDALAHAHARGVVHRDIKPRNLLLCTADNPRPGLKLSDFGIAHAMDAESWGDPNRISGTLHFMAPEQLRGEWRDYGPWTDLYALGCTAWQLASGRVPFHGLRGRELVRAHMTRMPSGFVPKMPVPPGFAAWLSILMAKSPADRYGRAAEAVHALLDLGDPVEPPPSELPPESVSDETLMLPSSQTRVITLSDTMPEVPRVSEAGEGPRVVVRVPDSWRQDSEALPLRLAGAGAGLWGLRPIPMTDRDIERDALWSVLAEVQRTREPRAVVLRGRRGLGRSRLARWLARRAHEVGVAEILSAVHSPEDAPLAPLERLLARLFQVQGLPRPAVADRLHAALDEGRPTDARDIEVLTEFISPYGERERRAGLERSEPPSPSEASAVLGRMLAHVARHRVVVVVLDNLQWGAPALGMALALLVQERLPVLFVLTVRSEEVPSRPVEASRLRRLTASPRALELELEPLDEPSMRQLVDGMLAMEPELAARIVERSAGNPSTAVSRVGHLLSSDALEAGRRGFGLRAGRALDLPSDRLEAWRDTIDQVVAGLPEHARICLERAAVLGGVVDLGEWSAVDGDEPLQALLRARLVERLLRQRWIDVVDGRVVFGDGELRRALETVARAEGRLADHHKRAADVLTERYRREEPGVAERLGRHLLGAGRPIAAVKPLVDGARHRRSTVGVAPALALLEEAVEAMEHGEAGERDRRWATLDIERAMLLRQKGDLDGAQELAGSALARSARHGWGGLARSAHIEIAQVLAQRGKLAEATDRLDEVMDDARKAHDDRMLADAGFLAGGTYRALGQLRTAQERVATARAAYGRLRDGRGRAECAQELGSILLRAGRLDQAGELYEVARRGFEEHGPRAGLAEVLNGLGEVARKRGELDAAVDLYEASASMYEALGAGRVVVPWLNLALVQLARGDAAAARVLLDRTVHRADAQGRDVIAFAARLVLLEALASLGDWGALDVVVRRVQPQMDTAFRDPDLHRALLRAAMHAGVAGRERPQRALSQLAEQLARA